MKQTIRSIVITAVLSITVIGSAFAQDECDELAIKYQKSKEAFNSLQQRYNSLQLMFSELLEETKETIEINEFTISELALEYVKDWYSFYKRDYAYRDVKVRQESGNQFYISVKERRKEDYFDWEAEVYYLTIGEDGDYYMSPFGFKEL